MIYSLHSCPSTVWPAWSDMCFGLIGNVLVRIQSAVANSVVAGGGGGYVIGVSGIELEWCVFSLPKALASRFFGTDVHAQHTYIYRYHCASHHVISYSHHIISYHIWKTHILIYACICIWQFALKKAYWWWAPIARPFTTSCPLNRLTNSQVSSWELTYHPPKGTFEDDFRFPKVGYVGSLEGGLQWITFWVS